MSDVIGDLPLALELLSRGVYMELDMIGREAALGLSVTAKDALSIPKLIEAGYEDRIVLGHDVCWKTDLKHCGASAIPLYWTSSFHTCGKRTSPTSRSAR